MNYEEDYSLQINKLRELKVELANVNDYLEELDELFKDGSLATPVRRTLLVLAGVISFLDTEPSKTWAVNDLLDWIDLATNTAR